VTEQELKDFVAKNVAHYKELEGGVTFLDAIPRHKNGGILRKLLFEKYCL
jgi:4-coumarate--CoA ligase